MYLSRVVINRYSPENFKTLTHLGAYHDWVERSFPAEFQAGIRPRHLWRIDSLANKQYLVVLSETAPDLHALEAYGVPETAVSKSYDHFLDQLQVGQVLRFKLTANPTHRVPQAGHKTGKVYPHVTAAQQRQWLIKRAESAGFQLLKLPADDYFEEPDYDFKIINRDWPILFRKPGHGHRVKLSRVTFEGMLKINDLDAFKHTLTQGIGREKAFGMGLMTVVPQR
ncbi:type I-E CRISPR-associated protein Cas6/Cse3/CasE [Levilactobacillus zymae]|uniref:Type I-E CRISPR-associated protein Cas6/Cse3/CasE n=1 Tax=Levilactobacillus zymae TaxID=267363 RepID=A0ABQ0WYF7_9LACO|nr:type I-E CRISPR-associated protein Cas6/Cse3/CasE [Levilactobacillus zymae]KRL16475.1 CRISPR associated family protein [Levilactobacillus zymae DSM 19395]QFR60574.1 type I-E CRISPR-associated protein Cas6/Cse3/CasE [Levilactobacillus zymae]GEO72959.1 type I-E CRISPR-associated protein Cas6/Cse3/CasE [Levilactobacillus zymae]